MNTDLKLALFTVVSIFTVIGIFAYFVALH